MSMCILSQEVNLADVLEPVWDGKWPGVEEAPYGLDLAVRLIRISILGHHYGAFVRAVLFWNLVLIEQRMWV
jgi:hypothetical protein